MVMRLAKWRRRSAPDPSCVTVRMALIATDLDVEEMCSVLFCVLPVFLGFFFHSPIAACRMC